jgi:hypothetical protein
MVCRPHPMWLDENRELCSRKLWPKRKALQSRECEMWLDKTQKRKIHAQHKNAANTSYNPAPFFTSKICFFLWNLFLFLEKRFRCAPFCSPKRYAQSPGKLDVLTKVCVTIILRVGGLVWKSVFVCGCDFGKVILDPCPRARWPEIFLGKNLAHFAPMFWLLDVHCLVWIVEYEKIKTSTRLSFDVDILLKWTWVGYPENVT